MSCSLDSACSSGWVILEQESIRATATSKITVFKKTTPTEEAIIEIAEMLDFWWINLLVGRSPVPPRFLDPGLAAEKRPEAQDLSMERAVLCMTLASAGPIGVFDGRAVGLDL